MFDITQSRFPFVFEHEYTDGDVMFQWVISDDYVVTLYDLRKSCGQISLECDSVLDDSATLRESVNTIEQLDQCIFDWLEYCQQCIQDRFNALSVAADFLEKASVQWVSSSFPR